MKSTITPIQTVEANCPLVRTNKFVSIGPKNKAYCNRGESKAWSAASKGQDQNNNYIMTEMYKK